MAIQVSIKITGDKAVQAKVNRLGRSLYKFKTALTNIGEQATDYYSNEGYASQGGVFGEPWKQLSPVYARWKAKHYPGRPLLVRSGSPGMRSSFEYAANDRDVIVSNSAPQFKYHQSNLPRRRLPRRKMIGINSRIKAIIKSNFEDDIRDKIRRA